MEKSVAERLKKFYGLEFEVYASPQHIDNNLHVSVDHKYMYCDIPKAGCTTIKQTLVESVERKVVNYNVHDRAQTPLRRPSEVFDDIKELEAYFKFTFVRNPYTRMLSAYLDKIQGNKLEKRGIVNVLGMDINDYENIDIPFKLFLDTLASMEIRRMNGHFRPQVMQSCYAVINYNYIGKFESFEADLVTVLEKLGCRNVSPRMIKTIRHHKTNASELHEQYYDAETENLVKEIYKDDFLEFGY